MSLRPVSNYLSASWSASSKQRAGGSSTSARSSLSSAAHAVNDFMVATQDNCTMTIELVTALPGALE